MTIFLSTLSLRRATAVPIERPLSQQYFYPRSPCGERLHGFFNFPTGHNISIHALLAESDNRRPNHIKRNKDFYPRSPCGERHRINCYPQPTNRFLSTLSLRRATTSEVSERESLAISIHALLAESDLYINRTAITIMEFLSTLSLRRATSSVSESASGSTISIHALLAESDKERVNQFRAKAISIHALLAESDKRTVACIKVCIEFLSTLSLRRATASHLSMCNTP